ncbi:MAG: glycerol-3-phosphate acyltransferase, partial [Candidatus Cloacimonetes bacterium]|nr:glycerol-3-phosphate acyltransferase [Candidatus Cloacimonadota bacterium]
MLYIILIIIVVLAYFWGSASTARIVAKSVRSLNIYKVGSGLADTENIYTNVSKPLGILVGALDAAKSYAFLLAVETLFRILHQHTQ